MKDLLNKIVSKLPSKWFEESEERKMLREYRAFFAPKPARTVEEVEEWCKRKLEIK